MIHEFWPEAAARRQIVQWEVRLGHFLLIILVMVSRDEIVNAKKKSGSQVLGKRKKKF